ncbi:interleukin-22 receptor subunit alpha-1 isoform X2 [Heterocephalus glaber]|uniref:Interleukin-22 receptor subunit alpha-1 isoform X2 n=1 Tax=Heterocephalus glaber TaxID=10181 RepID=A0AAX6T8Q8_HETGA|nr:interleukin-22 receptor subunit alpha-1 isoform X2 [Heterocephalus glaber]
MNQPPDQINKPACHSWCSLQPAKELPWIPPRTWNSRAQGQAPLHPAPTTQPCPLTPFPAFCWVPGGDTAKAARFRSLPSVRGPGGSPEGPGQGHEDAPDHPSCRIPSRYGEPEWLAKVGCQQITQKSCNLTMETGNLTELYYARVTAISSGGWSATKMTERFNSLQHTTIKPPDVTCVPQVRSIQMIVHPTPTPVHTTDGHQLTLEEIFQDLFYRLELHVNHTYQMHLGGKQREFEFSGLTPDTEFLGSIVISVPTWSKESAPYVCRVKTLPDRTWTYFFSGAVLFFAGFLVTMLFYLSNRYITKPPVPPNSLNVQRVLTFQPLRFIQEHVLIPALDLSSPSSLAQPVQYAQVMISGPTEPPGATTLHNLPEMAYLGHSDVSILRAANVPPHQTLSPPSYNPKAAPEVRPLSYTLQVAPDAKALLYTPQAFSTAPPPSYTSQATGDGGPASYGVCLEGCGTSLPPGMPSSPKLLRPKGQLQKEAPVGSCIPGDFSLQGVSSVTMEGLQEAELFRSPLGVCTDRELDLHVLHNGDPETLPYLQDPLSLLSSVQIEGHPVSLPLHPPSLSCSTSNQGPHPWGLLDSLVCPKDEVQVSEAEPLRPGPRALELKQSTELDSLFQGLALTVQWES